MGMCKKCSTVTALIFIVVGLLFLLADLGVWTFWGINWWTALFIIYGVVKLCSSGCAACNRCCAPKEKKK